MLAGGGYDLGLLLDGDADRAGCGRRARHVHPPAPGHRPADVLPRRASRPAPAGRRRASTTPRWRHGSASIYGIQVYETPVGFKYIGPKMIETGAMMGAEESGGYGFGMHLPERDGIYADLMLLDLFLREKAAGRWPVSQAIEHFHEIAGPSFYQRVDVHVDARRLPRDEAAPARRAARRRRRPSSPASRSTRTHRPRHERRLQVLRRRRLVAAGPDVGHRAAGPGLRRGDLGRDAATRSSRPASSWSAARDAPTTPPRPRGRRVDKPWGHELIWAAHRPLRRQDPRHRDRPAALAPAPRGQGRVDLRHRRAGCACTLEGDDGMSAIEELGPGRAPAGARRAASTATRRSSAASSSRSRRPSSTTSSASRTTSGARGRTRPEPAQGRVADGTIPG